MIRCLAIAAIVLCLAGCFVFDNPFDVGSRATITFQIVVHGGPQPGTYEWSSQTAAFEMMFGNTRYYFSMDGTGRWRLEKDSGVFISSNTTQYVTLPPTSPSGWSPSDQFSSIDDGEGGISGSTGYSDVVVPVGQTLHVNYHTSDPTGLATYQWQQSSLQNGTFSTTIGTAATCTPASAGWVRVVVTPTSGSGKHGTPAVSAPVYVN